MIQRLENNVEKEEGAHPHNVLAINSKSTEVNQLYSSTIPSPRSSSTTTPHCFPFSRIPESQRVSQVPYAVWITYDAPSSIFLDDVGALLRSNKTTSVVPERGPYSEWIANLALQASHVKTLRRKSIHNRSPETSGLRDRPFHLCIQSDK